MKLLILFIGIFILDAVFALPANQERAFDIQVQKLEVIEVPPDATLQAFDFEAARKGKTGGVVAAAADDAVMEDRSGKEEDKPKEEAPKEEEPKMEEKKEEEMKMEDEEKPKE